LWVESETCSTAQPCPSGKSSAFSTSQNCSMRGRHCWRLMYWMVGWLPGGSAGTSFCNGTEMSISFRAIAPAPVVLAQASGLNVEQLGRGAAEDVSLLIVAQRCASEDVIHRLQLPGEGIVAAEHELGHADLRRQMPDRFRR